jgi:hypothetical protein
MSATRDLEDIRDLVVYLNEKRDWSGADELLLHRAVSSLEHIAGNRRPMTRAEAEVAYRRACLHAIHKCEGLAPPYRANWWRSLIVNRGAVAAALYLTRPGSDTRSGCFPLIHRGRADLSVEWSMLLPQWDILFQSHPVNRAVSYRRLRDAGVQLLPQMNRKDDGAER